MSRFSYKRADPQGIGVLEAPSTAEQTKGGMWRVGKVPLTSPPRVCDSVLCFGDSDWWYHNRGHADMQFMRRFAKQVPVLYINSLGVSTGSRGRSDSFLKRARRKLKSMGRYYRDGGEGFRVLSPMYLPA